MNKREVKETARSVASLAGLGVPFSEAWGLVEALKRIERKHRKMTEKFCNEPIEDAEIDSHEKRTVATLKEIEKKLQEYGINAKFKLSYDPRGQVLGVVVKKNGKEIEIVV